MATEVYNSLRESARFVAICCRYGYGYLMFLVARERYRGSGFSSRVI
jgi:hypothetical protein